MLPRREAQGICLRPWWRPDYWLRLLYLVWIDQLGYWIHVRPRLRRRRSRARLAIQIGLGDGLVIGSTLLLLEWVLARLGHPLADAEGATLVASGVIGIAFGELNPWAEPVVDAAIAGLGLYSISVVEILAQRGQVVASWPHGFALGVVLGLCYGVREALSSGVRWRGWAGMLRRGWVAAVVAAGLSLAASKRLDEALVTAVTMIGGAFLANRWATRQVRDEVTRRWLARGRVESPAGR